MFGILSCIPLYFVHRTIVNNVLTRHLPGVALNGELDWLKSMMNKFFTIFLWTKYNGISPR